VPTVPVPVIAPVSSYAILGEAPGATLSSGEEIPYYANITTQPPIPLPGPQALSFQEKMDPFVPSWGLTRGSVVNTPMAARDFVMNVITDADRFQYRALRNGIVGGQFCQTLYDNLAAGSEILHRFCWLRESYEKVSKSHEVFASKIEKFMEDRVTILKENIELHESQTRFEADRHNMEDQLGTMNSQVKASESVWKHRMEVCEAQLSKTRDELPKCQEALNISSDLLGKANASCPGERVKELDVCFTPFS
jgi:hypothetical protein